MRVWLASLAMIAAFGSCVARAAEDLSSTHGKMVALSRLIVNIQPGTQFLVVQRGFFCSTAATKTWPGGEVDQKLAPYMETFRSQMRNSGLTPEPEASLFDAGNTSPAEYAVAGVITAEHLTLCAPDASPAGINRVKGEGSMTIDWQLYSRLENKVVARVHTTGSFSSKDPLPGSAAPYVNGAFGENVRQFAADPGVRQALSGAGLSEGELLKPPSQDSLPVPQALGIPALPIDRAGQGVVVIYAGAGLGSGILISREGYVLTDAHVVGDARSVRLRWSDGKNSTAEVVRISKKRDVAILKTDASGHTPLPLRTDAPAVGETVFAIGAPEGQEFQGTVTKGVVSAKRIFFGLNYIQSDVTAGHGSSGGPLLDERGRVVGLTELGLHSQTTSGINLFTPMKDAVEFLNLDLR